MNYPWEQAQKAVSPLAMGYRFWFGHPVAAEVPYNRGELPAGYLIASAEDMAHYLIAHLNGGHYKGVTLVSQTGLAELHRPAVKAWGNTFYGMGWIISTVNNVSVIYHAGETANFSTNMTLMPKEQWGFILLTNIYPGVTGNQIRKLYIGIVNFLVGRTPPATKIDFTTQLQVIALPTLLILQLIGFSRSLVILRRWRTRSKQGNLGVWFLARHIGLPLIVDIASAIGLLIGLPILFNTPLSTMLFVQPDLIGIAVFSASLAVIWGVLRTGLSICYMRKTTA